MPGEFIPPFAKYPANNRRSPGRFFAANEIKAIASYVILNYDIKFADKSLKHGEVPRSIWLGIACLPDSKVEMIFTRRETT